MINRDSGALRGRGAGRGTEACIRSRQGIDAGSRGRLVQVDDRPTSARATGDGKASEDMALRAGDGAGVQRWREGSPHSGATGRAAPTSRSLLLAQNPDQTADRSDDEVARRRTAARPLVPSLSGQARHMPKARPHRRFAHAPAGDRDGQHGDQHDRRHQQELSGRNPPVRAIDCTTHHAITTACSWIEQATALRSFGPLLGVEDHLGWQSRRRRGCDAVAQQRF